MVFICVCVNGCPYFPLFHWYNIGLAVQMIVDVFAYVFVYMRTWRKVIIVYFIYSFICLFTYFPSLPPSPTPPHTLPPQSRPSPSPYPAFLPSPQPFLSHITLPFPLSPHTPQTTLSFCIVVIS